MINLKNMYKNSKHGILMKTFLFVAFLFLSLGLYFCFAPKNEVSGEEGNDAESSFTITLQGSNDVALDELVQSGTATYNGIQGTPAYSYNNDTKKATLSVPMESGSRKVEVTLTACDGATISSVTKKSSDPIDITISTSDDSTDKTYKFTISDCKPGGEITCNVSGYKTSTITLQGIKTSQENPTFEQDIGDYVKTATAKWGNGENDKVTVDNVSNGTETITLNDVAFPPNAEVTVTLTPKDGSAVYKVYSGERFADKFSPEQNYGESSTSLGQENSDFSYTFTITEYPGQNDVTYTVSCGNRRYPLCFKDVDPITYPDEERKRRFTVYKDNSTSTSQSVHIESKTPTDVTIVLDQRCSQSKDISLTPHGKFAERYSDNVIQCTSKESGDHFLVENLISISFNGFESIYFGNSEENEKDNISKIYSSDGDIFIVKMKNGDYRIFKKGGGDGYDQSGGYLRLSGEMTDYYVNNGKNIVYNKIEEENGSIKYNFTLLNPDISIDPNYDYFTVNGVQVNEYYVTVRCAKDTDLSSIAENLNINGNSFQKNDDDFYCVETKVKADQKDLSFTLSATQGNVGASNYVKWFSKKSKLDDVVTMERGNAFLSKNDAIITLNEVQSDIDITLNAPDLIKNIPLNFKMDEEFKELISIYKATSTSGEPETSDPDQPTGQYEKGNPLENNTDTKLGVSILSDKTFHYIVAANSAGEGITENDIKSMLLDENDNDNPKPKITAKSSSTGIKEVKVGYQENAAVTSDYDKHFIILTVTIGPVDPMNEPEKFNINLNGMKLPTRTLTVESQENMAVIELINGLEEDSSDNDSTDGSEDEDEGDNITKYKFNYNSALEFNIKPTDRYEIYNPDTDITITRKDGTPIDYDYERATIKGKEGYNIRIKPEKYDITVKITFDPLHKVISLNNVEGFSYYEVRKNSNENENETAAATIQIDGEDYEVGKNKIHGKYTVKVGDKFYFAVKQEQGYDLGAFKILLDGKELDDKKPSKEIEGYEGYRIYEITDPTSTDENGNEIKGIQNDHTISGSISKLKHTVTFKGDNKYTDAITYKRDGVPISGSVEVEYGDNVSFTVDIGEKYNKSKFKIKDEHGVEINLVDGKYLLVNITSDKTITVKDIALNSYNINFVKSDAVKFLDENSSELSGIKSVMYGDKLSFKVEARDGYAITEQMKVISVSESGVRAEVKPDKNGNYLLNNVTEDYEISIENVENVMFKVTLAPTDGVTYLNDGGAVISGVSKVKYGNNFEFSVNVDDAYDDSIAGMYIIVNGGNLSAQKLATGRYIIPNITEDVLIRVGNIRKNSYNVTLVKVDGMDYYDASKKVINGDNSVNHGDSFSFKIGLYPAYSNSSVKVMLGNEELTANDSGFYTVPKVIENKTVTIVGVEENEESKVVNTINNLPSSVSDLTDVDAVIAATRDYEKLSDEQKQKVSNIDALRRLQEQVKEFHHVSNDVRISGVDWNIKLVAVPISFDKEACTRIYKKLNSEYIVSLYDVYLWDVINDVKYNLPEGKEATITLPKPDLTYFEKPTGIHEKDGGKISYLSLSIGSDIVRFTTDSFSPMGIIANRSLAPGRSSLLDAADANIGLIRDYALSTFGSGGGNNKGDSYSDINLTDANDSTNLDGTTGNINEKFKSRNNPVTAQGSAIRLALVLMLLILLAIVIIIIIEGIKRRKKEKSN